MKKISLLILAFCAIVVLKAQTMQSVDLSSRGMPLIVQIPEGADISIDEELKTIDIKMEDGSFGYFIMEMPIFENATQEALDDVKLHKEVVSDNTGKGAEDIKFSRFVKSEPNGVLYENKYADGDNYFEFYRVVSLNGKNYLFENAGMTENDEQAFINTFNATGKTVSAQ